ncbi:MAG TPA: MarR family winged helix-turn-helix transcriptional regulator [Thermoanaerobaculia bacterium]|nr:MarR family winged helix-turn-helix transcriptional regulator [Thermoanaerobaculia bacterium]
MSDFHRSLSELRRILQFRDRDRICCYGVSVTQSHVLDAIAVKGELSLNDVAAQLYVDKSTASRSVKVLEEKGLIRRRRDAGDARAIVLELTAAGQKVQEKIEEECKDEERQLLNGFDPAARRAITEFVRRLTAAASCGVETTGGSCCRID